MSEELTTVAVVFYHNSKRIDSTKVAIVKVAIEQHFGARRIVPSSKFSSLLGGELEEFATFRRI